MLLRVKLIFNKRTNRFLLEGKVAEVGAPQSRHIFLPEDGDKTSLRSLGNFRILVQHCQQL